MQGNVVNMVMIPIQMKRRGCLSTLVEHNEVVKLELLRASEPLDSSKLSRLGEGLSSYYMFPHGNKTR